MSATFFYAVRYLVNGLCETPLRVGAADGDLETVLTDADGIAFVPGSSLAGAMRNWLEGSAWRGLVEALFGSQKHPGSLLFSDARFTADAPRATRPRLRICGKRGSADEGGKFDVAQLSPGAKFAFTLTWLGRTLAEDELAATEGMLAALNSSLVRLGAQKSNGFGRVTLQVRKRAYDLRKADARAAWRSDEEGGDLLELPSMRAAGNVAFTLTGMADSLLVRSASVEYRGDGQQSVTPNLAEGGAPILPASSIKGAVRARVEMIARAADLPASCTEALFGRGAESGDMGVAGSVRFEDVRISAPQKREISRIRIDRFTGGVIRGGLFTEEPLCGEVRLRLTAPAEPLGCALLFYALRDLGLGLYNLGSGSAIGRGYLRVERLEAHHADGRTASLRFAGAGCEASDPEGLFAEWMRAWKEAIR